MAKIEPKELTPEQVKTWEVTLAVFMWSAPGWRHLMYKLLANNDGKHVAIMTNEVPVAATDGDNIMINPKTFLTMPLKEQVFVLAHEVLHNVYNDPMTLRRLSQAKELRYPDGVVLPFNNSTFQRAADYRINAALVSGHIGTLPTGEFKGLYDEKIATANDGIYDVYRKVYEDDQKNGKGKGQGPGQGFDQVLQPGTSQGQDPNTVQRNNQAWATGMAQAQQLEQSKAQGNLSADIQRLFDMYLKPKVPWADHIQGFFNRKLGSGSYDWRRPDRRLIVRDIYAPGRSGHGVGWICVWGDTSGSISRDELNQYFAELAGMIEDLKPKRITVFWCDSKIKFVDDLYDDSDLHTVKARGVGGGGGTSVKPVFEAIDKMSYEPPDAFVGLTDGLVTFPSEAPRYPCVWACSTDTNIPWGEVVRIKG